MEFEEVYRKGREECQKEVLHCPRPAPRALPFLAFVQRALPERPYLVAQMDKSMPAMQKTQV